MHRDHARASNRNALDTARRPGWQLTNNPSRQICECESPVIPNRLNWATETGIEGGANHEKGIETMGTFGKSMRFLHGKVANGLKVLGMSKEIGT